MSTLITMSEPTSADNVARKTGLLKASMDRYCDLNLMKVMADLRIVYHTEAVQVDAYVEPVR